jgi:DNA repair protein RadC
VGADQLSSDELLAIILQTGGARNQDAVAAAHGLLRGFGGVGGLSRQRAPELTSARGVGPAKAAIIMAVFELGRRALLDAGDKQAQVRSAHDVASIFEAKLRGLDREQLHVILLSTKNHVLRTCRVYEGNLTSSIVRPAEVFKEAIRENAASIIVAHNHPSGDPTPSQDDVRVTREIVAAGKVLDIDVLDHLVIGDQSHGWVSLRERKLGFDVR